MRECPRCHFVDPAYWRHPAFYPELDYTLFEDFPKSIELASDQLDLKIPELRLEPGKYLVEAEVTNSAYYLSRTGKWSYRVWLPIYRAFAEGNAAPHSKIRAAKFYDSSGRINKTAYSRLLGTMNRNRLAKNRLDQYLLKEIAASAAPIP
jgi:hypothetical protein